MKINKNIWTGKNKPYNRNSLYFPDGVNSGEIWYSVEQIVELLNTPV